MSGAQVLLLDSTCSGYQVVLGIRSSPPAYSLCTQPTEALCDPKGSIFVGRGLLGHTSSAWGATPCFVLGAGGALQQCSVNYVVLESKSRPPAFLIHAQATELCPL